MGSRVLGALLVAAFALSSLCGEAFAQAQPKKVFVRQSLQEFLKDDQKIVSLVQGIAVMRQRNSAPKDSALYRTSWEYWANIHGYPGGPRSGKVADIQQALLNRFPEEAPLFAGLFGGLVDVAPPDDLARKVWDTCKHGSRTSPEPHFLGWHRMYLYFFERVLRQASGDPNFALPYWDYTNNVPDAAAPQSSPWRMPAFFAVSSLQGPSGPFPNPLFERRRTAGFGLTVQLDPIDTNVDSTLGLDTFAAFQNTLELNIHGFIHCAVGNRCLGPYMGIVPFAGNEPIFWHHHANIDRLWECWTERYGRDANPIGDSNWMKEEFTFVDENGNEVKMKVSELFDANGRIDYVYDNVKKCFRVEPPPVQRRILMSEVPGRPRAAFAGDVRTRTTEFATTTGQIQISRTEQEVPLTVSNAPGADEAFVFAGDPNPLRSSKAVLKLEGVQLAHEPGATIRVFLVNKTGSRAFVGSLNFFGWSVGHGSHGPASTETGRAVSFDVTRQLRELQSGGAASQDLSVVFVAATGLTGATTAVAEGAYRRADIRIRKISLDVEEQARVIDLR